MDSQDYNFKKKKFKIKYGRLIFLLILVAAVVFVSKNYTGASVYGDIVIATVDGYDITQTELNEKYANIPEYYQSLISKKDLLNQMIDDLILLETAKTEGFDVTEIELMEAVSEIRNNLNMDEEAFLDYITEQGLELENVLISIKNKLLLDKFLDETLFSELKASEQELQNYYEENKATFNLPERVKASHILLKSKDVETLTLIADLKHRAESGEDFAELAKEYSECPSSASGGDLGTFAKTDMVPEFSEVAFNTAEGQISEPVLTDFGYHIIYVKEKLPEEILSFENVKENIEEQILSSQKTKLFKDYIEQLRLESDIEIYFEE